MYKGVQAHGPFIYISLLGVHPDMQRKGLGGQLLTTVSTSATVAVSCRF